MSLGLKGWVATSTLAVLAYGSDRPSVVAPVSEGGIPA